MAEQTFTAIFRSQHPIGASEIVIVTAALPDAELRLYETENTTR